MISKAIFCVFQLSSCRLTTSSRTVDRKTQLIPGKFQVANEYLFDILHKLAKEPCEASLLLEEGI